MVKSTIDVTPSGWMYGFPRDFDFKPSHPNLPGEEYEKEFRDWIVDCGYPRKLLKVARYRYWKSPK